MAATNVSSCVLSIVASFSSGLDVFKRLREKRKRKQSGRRGGARKCDARADEEELRLSRSLRQGHEDIGREYAQSAYAVGDGFAIGDALAQTSLAEILLKLNTGLVGIISSFLNSDKRTDMQLDYQALTQLSDRSRIDTCRALRQLFKRLTQPKPLPAIMPQEHINDPAPEPRRSASGPPRRKRKASTTSHARVKGPMLARVVIADSSKPSQIAMVKPSERRKKSSSASSSELSKASSTPSTPPPEYAPEPPPRPVAVRANTAPAAAPKAGRKAAAGNRPSPSSLPTQAARSTPRLAPHVEQTPSSAPLAAHHLCTAPPLPQPYRPAAAKSTPLLPPRGGPRKATPTYYSIASDSTRLGEIPLHKWHEPYDFERMEVLNREAERKGWPGGEMGAGEDVGVEGRRRGWGLRRLFGRK